MSQEGLKQCPSTGSKILSEDHFEEAYAITDGSDSNPELKIEVIKELIDFLFKNSIENPPRVLLAVTEENFKLLQNYAVERTLNKKKRNKHLKSLVHIKNDLARYTWQQDMTESFFEQETGSPIINIILSSNIKKDYIKILPDIEQVLKEYNFAVTGPVQSSKIIKTPMGVESLYFRDHQGGNIDGLPGGRCISGDKQEVSFTKQFCGPEVNNIKVYTSWLEVSHLDEIFKIIKHKDKKNTCTISVYRASPIKAFEMMSSNPMSLFLEFEQGDRLKLEHSSVVNSFCKIIGVDKVDDCLGMTNKEALKRLKLNSNLYLSQKVIEKYIQKDVIKIKDFLREKNQGCKVKEIPVPNIFYGGKVNTREKTIKNNTFFRSLFPSFTNSITLNRNNKLYLL